MERNQIFDTQRFMLLLRRDLINIGRNAVVIAGIIFGLLFITAFSKLSVAKYVPDSFYVITQEKLAREFKTMFMIFGLLISGIFFTDFRSKMQTQHYLLIPASTTEKFVSAFLITTVGVVVFFTLSFMLENLLLYIAGLAYGADVSFLNIFDKSVLKVFLYYLVFQSIFLAGSATFDKNPLLFTPLLIIGIAFGLLMVAGMLVPFIIGNQIGVNIDFRSIENLNVNSDWIKITAKTIFYLTPLVFWAITYFKIKEKQA